MKRMISVVLAALLLLFCGCKKAGYPVTAYGTAIDEAPSKIVSLSPNIDDMLSALGCAGMVAGAADSSPLCEKDKVIKVGTAENPDIDKIISVSPGIVFTNLAINAEDAERLNIRDIKIVVVPAAAKIGSLEEIYKVLGSCITGSKTGARNGETAYKALMSQIEKNKISAKSAVCVLSQEFDVATGDCFVSDFLTELGFENCAADAVEFAFTKAQIVAANPDIIICITGLKEKITGDETLSSCGAVQSGAVYEIDEDLLTRQGSGLLEAAALLNSFAD